MSEPVTGTPGTVGPRISVATRARLYLVGISMLVLGVAFAVFAVAWFQYTLDQRATDLSRQVSALAKGRAVSEESSDTVRARARDRLLRVEAGLMQASLFVTDDAGVVQWATTETAPDSLPLDRLDGPDSNGASSGVLRNAAGARVLVVAAHIDKAQRLVAVQGLSEIRQGQTGLLVIAAVTLLIAALVAYFAGGVMARRLTAPLVRLELAAEEVAEGAFGTQVAEEGDAETASLARSFNRMSTRVADAYAAQKAFVGDVSHEIRTPLTSIRGFAEAMLDGTLTDEAQQTRALGVIRDEAVRIGEVSQTLLALAELDAGAVEIDRTPVDVDTLADALRGRFARPAADAGLTLAVELDRGTQPLGDTDRLLQAVSALVANAIAYTPRGGRVRVTSARQADMWVLAVDDTGPGIPEAMRDEIFGRFSRLNASGSAEGGGSGLGLEICRRLVELMGGEVSAGDSDLGGACFAVRLPVARL